MGSATCRAAGVRPIVGEIRTLQFFDLVSLLLGYRVNFPSMIPLIHLRW